MFVIANQEFDFAWNWKGENVVMNYNVTRWQNYFNKDLLVTRQNNINCMCMEFQKE